MSAPPPAADNPWIAEHLRPFGATVFAEMTRLALRHDAVNLGQGFPDFDGPPEVLEAAARAIRDGHNQYCPTAGVPALRRAIAAHQERFWSLSVDPDREVTVTAGATEAIFATLQGVCEPGDEVVLFEPYYDSYRASVAMAGATARVVSLRPPDFRWDPEELAAAVGPRTRAILVNTPHNPTGRVFDRNELEQVADLCRRHDLVAVSDEVYEHLVFEGEHLPLTSLPGMAERTVTISSAGKTFSCTGWKVGWALAPPPLTAAVQAAHQFITFCNATPFQHAIATALGLDDGYYEDFLAGYRVRREILCTGLRAAGFAVTPPQGTYFALADLRSLEGVPGAGAEADCEAFCQALPATAGVAAIPPTSFYENRSLGRPLVRFAFCKTEPVLREAVERLGHHFAGTPRG